MDKKLMIACAFATLWMVCSITGADVVNQDGFADSHQDSKVQDVKDHDRTIRAIRPVIESSWKVVELLQRNARPVYAKGTISVYLKKGSYTEALEDFYAASPHNVRDLLSFEYIREASGEIAQLHKTGIVGRRRIFIGAERSGGSPVIALSATYNPGKLERLIIYKKMTR